MDRKTRSQATLLAVLLLVLAGVVVFRVVPALAPAPAAPSSTTAAAPVAPPATSSPAAPRRRGEAAPVDISQTAVRLDALSDEPPGPIPPERNPFRFGQGRAAAPTGGARPVRVVDTPPAFVPPPPVPTGPPPPPPIPYKFIGLVSAAPTGKVAVLSDGKGVYHGREGEIVEGQYRIVQIGEESVQIEYADGRGRQTIRLTGS